MATTVTMKRGRAPQRFSTQAAIARARHPFDASLDPPPHLHPFLKNSDQWWLALCPVWPFLALWFAQLYSLVSCHFLMCSSFQKVFITLKASVATALGCEGWHPLQLHRVFAAHGFGWAPNFFQMSGLEISCTSLILLIILIPHGPFLFWEEDSCAWEPQMVSGASSLMCQMKGQMPGSLPSSPRKIWFMSFDFTFWWCKTYKHSVETYYEFWILIFPQACDMWYDSQSLYTLGMLGSGNSQSAIQSSR